MGRDGPEVDDAHVPARRFVDVWFRAGHRHERQILTVLDLVLTSGRVHYRWIFGATWEPFVVRHRRTDGRNRRLGWKPSGCNGVCVERSRPRPSSPAMVSGSRSPAASVPPAPCVRSAWSTPSSTASTTASGVAAPNEGAAPLSDAAARPPPPEPGSA